MQYLGFHPQKSHFPLLQTLLHLDPSSLPSKLRTARSRGPSPSPPALRRCLTPSKLRTTDLRRLTSRIVELTRRRQLGQVLGEIEEAKKKYGSLNKIVMNAVMEACVHCGDIDSALRIFREMENPDSCGVDDISYGILLKGLGAARRVDEAFQMLESLEQDATMGKAKLSPRLVYALLNALLDAGDMRRANGLVARYRLVLQEEGDLVLLYNLLMKGYVNTDFPLGALTIWDEMLRQGLKPDKATYNTLLFAFIKSEKTDAAVQLLAEMKEEAQKVNSNELFPDAVTYTTLLKGLGNKKDHHSVQKILVEMKSLANLYIDRTAYTAMVDAMLACGSINGALCLFGEIIKLANKSNNLKPKPHLYLSMMRAFALEGDLYMVKRLHTRMWSDSVGTISPSAQEEADELLMEAAINDNQVEFARKTLSNIAKKQDIFSWTSRGGMVAVRVEALSGFGSSMFAPYILPQVFLDDPIGKYMTPFEEANPLAANLELKKVVMRFYRDSVVPVVDDWGCVGIIHREDCRKLNAPLWMMMKGPPPCVTASTSIGRVIDLLLEKKYKMLIVVMSSNVYGRPVGVFTRERLSQLVSNCSF